MHEAIAFYNFSCQVGDIFMCQEFFTEHRLSSIFCHFNTRIPLVENNFHGMQRILRPAL